MSPEDKGLTKEAIKTKKDLTEATNRLCKFLVGFIPHIRKHEAYYKGNQSNDGTVMPELFNGVGLLKNVKGKRLNVFEPHLSIVGAIQTQLLLKIINKHGMVDGTSLHFIYDFMEEAKKPLHPLEKIKIENSILTLKSGVAKNVILKLPDRRDELKMDRLEDEAQKRLLGFHYKLSVKSRVTEDFLYSPIRKMVTCSVRLSLVLHGLTKPKLSINLDTVEKAIKLVKHFNKNTKKVCYLVFKDKSKSKRIKINKKATSIGGEATMDKVKQSLKKSINFKEYGNIINQLT